MRESVFAIGVMAYVSVAEWKPDQVCEWLKGTCDEEERPRRRRRPGSRRRGENGFCRGDMSGSHSVSRTKLRSHPASSSSSSSPPPSPLLLLLRASLRPRSCTSICSPVYQFVKSHRSFIYLITFDCVLRFLRPRYNLTSIKRCHSLMIINVT